MKTVIASKRATLGVALLLSGLTLRCSSDAEGKGDGEDGGSSTGGLAGTGATANSGGQSASGGGSVNTGGRGSGGAQTQSGGASSTGGASAGGSSNSGGTSNSGGSANTGGSSSTGGTSNSGGSASGGQPSTGGATSLPGWKLVWSDEFDGASGTPPDSSKWNLVNKGDGFGNNELEFYTNRTDNAAMDGKGNLVITAKKEKYQNRDYTSARLESSGKFEHQYGRIEGRMKIPRGQGLWPAFWILGNDISSVSWPTCGEIDIMENVGKEPSIIHGSLHGPGYSGGNPLSGSYTFPNGAKVADDFHVFAVEWEVNTIRFYVDGNNYETHTNKDVPSGSKWVYDHPFTLLLNVAVGGQWPGSPDGTTTFPQTMTVDYVRVYDRS